MTLCVCFTIAGCQRPDSLTYPVPEQIAEDVPLLPDAAEPMVELDSLDSHGQIWAGFHPVHPAWLPGRWMGPRAELELRVPHGTGRIVILEGLVEQYQLQQTGPIHVRVRSNQRLLLEGEVAKDGPFHLEAPLAAGWHPEPEIQRIVLEAGPAWHPDGSNEQFTLTVTKVGFQVVAP